MMQASKQENPVLEPLRARLRAEIWKVAEGDPAPLFPLARALGAHFHLSFNNRLLVAVQAPTALRVRNPRQWDFLGYHPRPGAEGVVITGSRDQGFAPTRLYSEAEVGASAEAVRLRADILGASLGLENPDAKTFLWEGVKWMQNHLGHARNPRLWEELRMAELWMALKALEGVLGQPSTPDLDRAMVERAYGQRPALLVRSLERVAAAVDGLNRRLGLGWK
jgi:hypothetical protein